ncbi:MAG: hypothetical protein M3352_03635 [Bacteroidota bacterium]|jgi:hypothetical protein|nr:hypothetical protein [Bacteroidota bacterium]
MYTNVWNKYLPIIKILLKRAKNGDQVLDLNFSDFERAGIGRKSGYKFNIEFSKGRVDNVIINLPLASNLSSLLLQDTMVKELFMNNDYHISMNTKFQLSIKQIPAAQTDEAHVEEPAELAESEKN